SEMYSFSHMHPKEILRHAGFGFLLALFDTGEETLRVGNVHLHSGLRFRIRAAEALRIKAHLRDFGHADTPTIFGGDFNLGLPWELPGVIRAFAPEFAACTAHLGPTLDSRYTEHVPVLTNRIASAMAKVGLGISLRPDHIFTDAQTASHNVIECRVLPDRISDHSPVELILRSE
ncbi:MAG: hypothetical protein NUV59_04405, partial [Patescibacteria group bacterium]|nr:hypothetical protein [Patescibacteria group bacterium]